MTSKPSSPKLQSLLPQLQEQDQDTQWARCSRCNQWRSVYRVKKPGLKNPPGTLFVKCEACPATVHEGHERVVLRFGLDATRDVVRSATQPPEFEVQCNTIDKFFGKGHKRSPDADGSPVGVKHLQDPVEPSRKRSCKDCDAWVKMNQEITVDMITARATIKANEARIARYEAMLAEIVDRGLLVTERCGVCRDVCDLSDMLMCQCKRHRCRKCYEKNTSECICKTK